MALSDDVLRSRLASHSWTVNVRLSEGVETLPGAPEFLSTDRRLQAILRTLTLLYGTSLAGLRVADLGCLEGGFGLALARRGAHVVGVEARQVNLDKARLLQEHFQLETIEFVRADIKDFTRERFGTFDVVLALGVLYHLDEPVSWLRQLGAAVQGVLVVDSHLAPVDDAGMAVIDRSIDRLGRLERRDGGEWTCEGRWFVEVEGRGVDPDVDLWAAYSNDRSFWLTKESLLIALQRAGFDVVLEQQDWILDQYAVYTTNLVRSLFVACKTAAFQGLRDQARSRSSAGRPVGLRVPPSPRGAPGLTPVSTSRLLSALRATDLAIQERLGGMASSPWLTRYQRLRGRLKQRLFRVR